MFATTAGWPARLIILFGLGLVPRLCHAVSQEEKAAELAQLLATPGGKSLIFVGLTIVVSLAIWMSSMILGIEGGFWRSVVAAVVALVLGAIAGSVISSGSMLVSFVVGSITGAVAIKLCLEASLKKALICSVLSSVMTGILAFVLVIAVGIQFALH